MEKRKHSEKLIDDLKKLVKRCPALKPQVKALVDGIISNATAIDINVNESFKKMVLKRQAAKYAGIKEEDFKARIKAMIEKEQHIFENSRKLTKDDLEEIERMKAKAVATKAAKADIDLEDF